MSLVVDASAMVAELADLDSDALWVRSHLAGESISAPEMLLAESANILRRLERIVRLSATDAAAALDDLLRADIQLHPFAPYADRVWELRHNLTAYDAWYVAIAESLDCPLVTLDRRLARAPGPNCPVLTPP